MTTFQKPLFFFIFIFSTILYAQNPNEVTIKTTQLSDNVYMLVGQGGNIGVSVGEDGVFVIDDQFAPLTPKILEAIKKLSDKPIVFLANTHHHGDHTGGNVNMAKEGAKIIAHDNVRKRLVETPKRDGSMNPKESFPIITFNDKMNLYINDDQVAIFHVDNAHTDGDALLYFTNGNVLHTGDTYFNGRYPYIDLNSGGSVNGYIDAAKKGMILVDDNSKIIPGHGGLSNKTEYKTFLKMLETLRDNVQTEINKGKTEDDVAANTTITEAYDALDYGSGFISSEKIRRTLYKGLKK
jgi:glyoxylase-like metal-dependent hydrolase (beta-lactamase superfamily II)